jgi:hypothetical protein
MRGGGRDSQTKLCAGVRGSRPAPGVFLENETLFHEGENSWAGREESSHFNVVRKKYSVVSDSIAFILEFSYMCRSACFLSHPPGYVITSLVMRGYKYLRRGGGGGCLLSFFPPIYLPPIVSLVPTLLGDVSQNGRMRDEGGRA